MTNRGSHGFSSRTFRRLLWMGPSVVLLLTILVAPAAAQSAGGGDWRAALTCPAEKQAFDGFLYCIGQDQLNKVVHVFVADLANPKLRFEYILPEGRSDRNDETEECQDVNRPEWGGPAMGCYVSDHRELYPRITLEEAVNRSRETARAEDIQEPLVAVIDADYGSQVGNHGPEGFTVVRGNRLDGAAKCDDDYNAALRPWLALGETVDNTTKLIPATIDVLEADSSPWPIDIRSAWGGGPWLVQNGLPNPGAANCAGQKTLSSPDPILNCTGKPKSTPAGRTEEYADGSCRTAAHTAVGMSQNGRWLFMVVTTSQAKPNVIANFMAEQLHVETAIKFDGGGSSQFWVTNASPQETHVEGKNRPLTNWMAVYAAEGNGIDLPLDATPETPVLHSVVSAGKTTSFKITMHNTGEFTWASEDGVELQETSSLFRPIKAAALGKPLHAKVAPLGSDQWDWQSEPKDGGVALHRFRMARHGEAFGDEAVVLVVTIPKELEEQRAEIERRINEMIQEWQIAGQQKLEELVDQIVAYLAELTKTGLEKLIREICGNLGLAVILPAGIIFWRRRRS